MVAELQAYTLLIATIISVTTLIFYYFEDTSLGIVTGLLLSSGAVYFLRNTLLALATGGL